mgnify:CR=1 FL=1
MRRSHCTSRRRGLISTFSSLFLGIRFATPVGEQLLSLPRHQLSVPFSSGFALRHNLVSAFAACYQAFQFPFPRDSLCDPKHYKRACCRPYHFQFPFPRDSLCDRESLLKQCLSFGLSVPFSSGFALRPALLWWDGAAQDGLSVPFSSGFALRQERLERFFPTPFLSVPFSSGFALRLCDKVSNVNLIFTFSSLFLGIRFATFGDGSVFSMPEMSFSSLFLGIRFATSTVFGGQRLIWPSLSVPFSSGFALRHN